MKKLYEQYMEMTGDSLNYIFSGGFAYGIEFINDLVKEALENRKRIIWIDDFTKLDAMSYRLEDLD